MKAARARSPRPSRRGVPRLLGPEYLHRTRRLPVNLLFLMPWLLIYELSLFATKSPVENAAAAWLRLVVGSVGREWLLVLTLAAVLVLCGVVLLRLKEANRDRGIYGGMLVEGAVYGLLLGTVASGLASGLPMGRVAALSADVSRGMSSPVQDLAPGIRDLGLAVGAGIFEEVLFRWFLLGGIFAFLHHGLSTDRMSAAVVAILVSSYLFSDYHHWGVGGEPYDTAVFSFRFYAGAALGTIYLTRGLGIAAFAHAFYDLLVLTR